MDVNQIATIREIVIEQLKDSELSKFLNYRENEIILPDNITREMNFIGRVNKKNKMALQEFMENLCDAITEKLNNEVAAFVIEKCFEVQVGLCEGEKFEGVEVFDVDGKKVELHHQTGQVIMLDFWATWCKYCQEPMQENIDLVNKNSNLKDRNISIIGLSCDENVAQWKTHITERNWNVIPQYVRQNIREQIGIKGIPKILLVNKDGIIVYIGHPKSILLEETLINLSEGKPVAKKDNQLKTDPNPWFDSLDNQAKMKIVSDVNSMLKDAGVINGYFDFNVTYEIDPQNFEFKVKTSIPLFYGSVTQFEYDTIHSLLDKLRTTYNMDGFDFNMNIMKISDDFDF